MTDPRAAGEVLARARAARPAAARAAAVSPSAPPPDAHDEPRANSPADIMGSPPPRPARRAARPQTDREFLEALPGGAFEGVSQDAKGWWVTLLRPCGRRSWHRGKTEAAALARARRWWDARGTP